MRFKNKPTFALGRLKAGKRNRMEAEYETLLALSLRVGDVQWFKFEGLKLRLADNTFYTPDFAVMAKDGTLECHEVKGFWMDDARVKIKVAASIYPFKFIAATKKRGVWKTEEF